MKKLITLALATLLALPLFAADRSNNLNIERSSGTAIYTDCILDTLDRDTLYVLYPSQGGGDWYMSETLPTKATARNWGRVLNATGDLDWKIETNIVEGSTLPDSLGFWAKPLTYNPGSEVYEEIQDDSVFFVFDTPLTYTGSTVDYITVVDSKTYHCTMTDLLWLDVGFVFYMDLADTDSVSLSIRNWFNIGR